MKRICLIYRKPRPEYFSIEKVFAAVKKQLESTYRLFQIAAPHSRVTPWHVFQNILFVSKYKADLYHVTGDAHYLALACPRQRTVLTIHDCVFLHQTKGFKKFFLKKLLLDIPVRHARVITTISENSKKDIVTHTNCAPDKVVVIPNPIDEEIYFSSKEFDQACPVLLFIGTTPNKNLERVIQALKGIPCVLDIIGKLSPHHKTLLMENNIRYQESFSISSRELADKYANADLLLFPTTFEGFGLPIVEAQKAGRAVITSNLSPMKEVSGSGACLVDPYDISSIRNALLRVLSDSEYRRKLVEEGLCNAQRFSAERTAEGYQKVYDSLLS